MGIYKIGLDVGSTTVKIVVLDAKGEIVFCNYRRHLAKMQETINSFFDELYKKIGNQEISLNITGSVGMGITEKCSLPFIQEVVATTEYAKRLAQGVSTIVDIGGEDAKVVFLNKGIVTNLRMNGNCAGGTGAFIDQMAILLNVSITQLNELALNSTHVYSIASRCGVFSKTDIQNLMAKNVSKEDIAASIFHAVAVQTIATLSHGCDVNPPILFCGGPLTFIPALRKAFIDYLGLQSEDIILPEKSNMIPAWGAALSCDESKVYTVEGIIKIFNEQLRLSGDLHNRLAPIFKNADDYEQWKVEKARNVIVCKELPSGIQDVTLGIDSGSTTTKIVAIDKDNNILFSYYHPNDGNPIAAVKTGLELLQDACKKSGTDLRIKGSCSTGYGEDLIKAAFHLNSGIIETIAHYLAAQKINKEVTFILDIGGQDMKAIYVNNGVLSRMEINEACSSGCGSFIETFAKSLNYPVRDFAQLACLSQSPYDLGTRCTVFMNSKVKQALREGASVSDIAAGLSYSVIKNCLFKVLKLKDTEELGDHIVVQGGTMRNDSIVRALEQLIGKTVYRNDRPELMGAYGCALYAKTVEEKQEITLDTILQSSTYTTRQIQCHGCENQCLVFKYKFINGNFYYSGNKCENNFSNKGNYLKKGINLYNKKNELLFDRPQQAENNKALTIGIPRCLNMFENYPFWQSLFLHCNLSVCLSDVSTFFSYERNVKSVMSDNICFPAKLVHSHIANLVEKKVDRIFFPYVLYEKRDTAKTDNTYNCPIVSGYSEVIRSSMKLSVPLDAPAITFKDKKLLYKQCYIYLRGLGVKRHLIKPAFRAAISDQELFISTLKRLNEQLYDQNRKKKKLTVLLAGRPYHTDPLVQHKLSDMIASMGVDVLTDDIVRDMDITLEDTHFVTQWAYADRILKAAKWVAAQDNSVQFIEMTSFGCGPDAFLVDEIKKVLQRSGKTLTLLKIDDINNIGSIKLRVRSVVESFKLNKTVKRDHKPFVTTPIYTKEEAKKKIIVPFFTAFISPIIPDIFKLVGYDVEVLPISNQVSADYGLKYANNEICYPATLIVGDIIKAFEEKKYDPENTAVAMTQTGGQCRASNYISLIKKALVEAGFKHVPVVSINFGSGLNNVQPGFKVNWFKNMPMILTAILYSDCLSKFYYASVTREMIKGEAEKLKDEYLEAAHSLIQQGNVDDLHKLLAKAATQFNTICKSQIMHKKVGIVGEIFLKFNAFAQKNVTGWFIKQNIEVVPPILTSFFMQSFVNKKVCQDDFLEKKNMPDPVIRILYKLVQKQINKINKISSAFQYFTPIPDILDEAKNGQEIVSLNNQFGEGWLLPAEIVSFAKQGITNVVSLQPFGCIANHIVAKGIEKRIKSIYPQMNLLSLDFDSGVSDVNITNRLVLFANNMK
ncbi:MAG: acyl-CoA dehydratase activase [Bacteroidaceae bacterium]|nr:acyl-CoA dehydratase activase [Bacteroidaceae bacterium]